MKNQTSILGFFQKSSPSTPSGARNAEPASSPAQRASEQRASSKKARAVSQNLTPAPSSDFVEPEEEELTAKKESSEIAEKNGLLSPATSTNRTAALQTDAEQQEENVSVTSSRRVS